MAILASWNGEGGTTGTDVTLANSGGASGTAFTQHSTGTGGTIQYAAGSAAHGGLGMRITQGTTGILVGWDAGSFGGERTSCYWRWMFRMSAIPEFSQALVRFRQIGGATDYVLRIDVSGAGRMRLRNSAGTQIAEHGTSLVPGTWYRMELDIVHGTGSVALRTYTGDSASLVATTGTMTGQSIGASTGQVHFGALFSTPQMPGYDLDDVAVDGSSNPGPVVITPPPPPSGVFSGWGAAARVG